MKRTLFQAMFHKPKLLPWSIQGKGGTGVWGRVGAPGGTPARPTLTIGVLAFGALALGALGYAAVLASAVARPRTGRQ